MTLGLLPAAAGVTMTLGSAGCDSNQFVLFTLQNLPTVGTNTVRTTYTLDSSPGKTGIARVTPPVDQFAIMFPPDTRGTLNANVRAYTYLEAGKCLKSEGAASIMLNGAHKQDLVTNMPMGAAFDCDATQIPVAFPPTDAAPLAAWGKSAKDIWVVGDKGMILHWDGNTFAQIQLSADLRATLPTWRAVGGLGSAVWVAGDHGVIAHYDGMGTFNSVSLVTPANAPLTVPSAELPSWVSLSVAEASTEEVYFVSSNGYIGHKIQGGTSVQAATKMDVFPVYPVQTMLPFKSVPLNASVVFTDIHCMSATECWFVGSDPQSFMASGQPGAGAIFQAFTYPATMTTARYTVYSDYSMSNVNPNTPVTRSQLRGVWGVFTGAGSATRQLYMVGENATLQFSNNSKTTMGTVEPNLYPKFQSEYSAVAAVALQGKSQKLNDIAGSSISDLWIVGDAGVLMRWAPTPALPANPFIVIDTGLTANLGSVFSTGPDAMGGRVYVSGDHQTFVSPDRPAMP